MRVPLLSRYCPRYRELWELDDLWARLADEHGAGRTILGRSVEGRAIRAYEFGDRNQPTVLLSALMHGIELIGGLALYDSVRALLIRGLRSHLVVVPSVNPDAVIYNLNRIAEGRRAGRRTNSRGVDLNRNFEWVVDRMPRHPFAGSRWRWSLHYCGPEPFSEPETRAIRALVQDVRPSLSLAFHSFGNLLLFPWAHSAAPNPRVGTYRMLARRFVSAMIDEPYEVRQAQSFYPTVGDMDDWLDARTGALAFTVEVSRLTRRILSPRRFLNPFFWMNPKNAQKTLANLVPGVQALIEAASEHVRLAPRGLSAVGMMGAVGA